MPEYPKTFTVTDSQILYDQILIHCPCQVVSFKTLKPYCTIVMGQHLFFKFIQRHWSGETVFSSHLRHKILPTYCLVVNCCTASHDITKGFFVIYLSSGNPHHVKRLIFHRIKITHLVDCKLCTFCKVSLLCNIIIHKETKVIFRYIFYFQLLPIIAKKTFSPRN